MRRLPTLLLAGLACGVFLVIACNHRVLFQGEQYAFRDAGTFYYPLHAAIQEQWRGGHIPLWDPSRNGGQPLLGNPVAAVLYPGKLIFAILPIAWASRLYIIGHTLLAMAGMIALGRSLGLSPTAALLAGISYAFGGPILFQYCNVIFLVGAAWLPLALRALDRLVRLHQPWAVAELAACLAMQALGGDLQMAYLALMCGFLYAATLWLRDRPSSRVGARLGIACCLVGWIAATLLSGALRWRLPRSSASLWWPALAGWLALLVVRGISDIRRRGSPSNPSHLVLAGLLAMFLGAIQLFSVADFLARSGRSLPDRPVNRYQFSVEPARLVEFLWPSAYGISCPRNAWWLQALPRRDDHDAWVPSLYLGGLPFLLALVALRQDVERPWRRWLVLVAALSLLASFGRFGGVLWWARFIPGATAWLGPHDASILDMRDDGWLPDATASPYSLLVRLCPGFGLFRYPGKLLTLTCAAMAVLAGQGWDDWAAGRARRSGRIVVIAIVTSLIALGSAWALRARALAWLAQVDLFDPMFGPLDPAAAWGHTLRGLGHGLTIALVAGAILALARRRVAVAGALAVVVTTIDLALAGAPLIWTVPQALFETEPIVAQRIRQQGEESDSGSSLIRVHRPDHWYPAVFRNESSPSRLAELVRWERDTLQPLHAMTSGFSYAHSRGVLDLGAYLEMHEGRMLNADAETAEVLAVEEGAPVYYAPRRAIDLWGARYFILPTRSDGWSTSARGFAALLFDSEPIEPSAAVLENREALQAWSFESDWQLVRNEAAYPRAWVVHRARFLDRPTSRAERVLIRDGLLYQNDPLWFEPGRPVVDLLTTAWIETDTPRPLRRFLSAEDPAGEETVALTGDEPGRVVLNAHLEEPGFVILSDMDAPGWRLTIDGIPAPILRSNRLMRAAAVTAGDHELIYTYRPFSFRVGAAVTAGTIAGLIALGLWRLWPPGRIGRTSVAPPSDDPGTAAP